MSIFLNILGSLIFSFFFICIGEYTIHRWLMHKNSFRRIFKIKIPYFETNYEYHMDHHFKYYKIFNKEEDPYGKYMNLKITKKYLILVFSIILIPVGLFISWISFFTIMTAIFIHSVLWNALHSEMHLDEKKWFSKTKYYLYAREHHELHHIYPNKNFNIVLPPFADILFGTHASRYK